MTSCNFKPGGEAGDKGLFLRRHTGSNFRLSQYTDSTSSNLSRLGLMEAENRHNVEFGRGKMLTVGNVAGAMWHKGGLGDSVRGLLRFEEISCKGCGRDISSPKYRHEADM